MDNQEWLNLDVKVATPNKELPIITTKMAICYCGEPCICEVVDDEEKQYIHAISQKEECLENPRNDPPT